MTENTWLVIDDDSSHCASDSDAIDSETEAELYSTIHYEPNINSEYSNPIVFKNVDLNHNSSPADFVSSQDNDISKQEKQKTGNLKENEISLKRKASLYKFNHDSNPTKKSKTDFMPNNNLSSDDSRPSFKRKSEENIKNIAQYSRVNQSPQKCDNSTVFDSTDSDDSNIWKEVDSLENSNFTINLSNEDVDTIYVISSDSDSEPQSASLPAFRKRDSVLRNLSMPNIKIGEKQEGEWYINSEDIYRSRKYSRRYHNNNNLLCSNCNRKGHDLKNCPEPKVLKCFICGDAHLGFRCPNRICGTCFQYGHDRMRCHMGPDCFSCQLCLMPGHTVHNCPDLWRRYHLTTNDERIVQGREVKQDSNIYCWNCGQTGHFGGVCYKGVFGNSANTWPCVISYDDPRKLLRNNRLLQEKNLKNLRLGHYFSSNEKQVILAETRKQKRKDRKAAKRRQRHQEKKALKKEAGEKKSGPEIQKCKKGISKNQRKITNIVREKNFDRVKKQILLQQCDETPRSLEILKKRKLRKERRKLNRLLKRQQQLKVEIPIKVEKE